ncbi:MAG TPA: LysR family transcriptional regulator [Kineosporiaceae bacterium]|nr:LysR family transcriptional regulator [Kineosporiaceae bacterium]
MDLDPRRLAVLATVARTGGILAAAEALRVTPSAVSQQVSRLEREAGVALVVRGGRRIELTAAGVELAAHGQRIAEEVASAGQALSALTGAVTGTVTVVGFPTAIAAVIAPAILAVRAAHPAVTVRVLDVPEASGLAQLRAGTADLVLLEHDAGEHLSAPRGLHDVPLLDDPYLLVTPAGHTLPRGARQRAALDLPWVAGPPGSATRSVLERLCQTEDVRPLIAHEALEFPAVLALVGAGLGVALVPRLALPAPAGLRAAGLRVLDLPGLGARQVVARHRTSRGEPSPAVRVVLGALTTASETMDGGGRRAGGDGTPAPAVESSRRTRSS